MDTPKCFDFFKTSCCRFKSFHSSCCGGNSKIDIEQEEKKVAKKDVDIEIRSGCCIIHYKNKKE
jgi:hypothetical protein